MIAAAFLARSAARPRAASGGMPVPRGVVPYAMLIIRKDFMLSLLKKQANSQILNIVILDRIHIAIRTIERLAF
jgi:hypothetical protein